MSRHVWAIVSDLHCGSTLGLIPSEGVVLDDGGRYQPSEAQRKLWHCWGQYAKAVGDTLQEGDKLSLALNGDLVDGDHHGTFQIVSKNLAVTQKAIALKSLVPLLTLDPVSIHVVRGTGAHSGQSGQFEEDIAKELGAVQDPETGAYSRWSLEAKSNGALLWFNHHGRMGGRSWTRMTGPATMAAEIVLDCASHDERPPDVAVFSHCHQWGDTYDNFRTRVIQTGAWQLKTEHTHRIAPGKIPAIGGLILVCEDGKVEAQKVKFPWKRGKPWELPVGE